MNTWTNFNKKIDKLLKKVEKPARYIGGELNSIIKNPTEVDIKIAFAFPDLYEIGMSYMGLSILYNILNRQKNIGCERVFAPAKDMESLMRKENIQLFSLETKTPVKEFDILGFTLQYEMAFTNILNMMNLAGIPLRAEERDSNFPVVVGGGPCAFNPEPLAPFFDMFLIGDGEILLPEICNLKKEFPKKEDFLNEASKLIGVYVPKFYEPVYKTDGTIEEIKLLKKDASYPVKKALLPSIENIEFPTEPIIPFMGIVHDRAVVETFRGCTRGCRFCQAGIIYRPIRERSLDRVKEIAKNQLKNTGHEELSLLSLSTSDYSNFKPLVLDLMSHCKERDISLSLPSLRLDNFSFDVLNEIQKYRKSGLTFAPEAGSQRLRDVINKNITYEDIYSAVDQAIDLGWQNIKLYFMIGLPTETYEDLDAIAEISDRILEINFNKKGKKGGRFNVTVSVSNFVPKPHTPFQWVGQNSLEEFKEKHNYLVKKLHKNGITFNYHDSPVSVLEAVFARGDRRLALLLESAYKNGATFDAWSETFNNEAWEKAFAETHIDKNFYANRYRTVDEILPWNIIDSSVSREFLISEYRKAVAENVTPDCRQNCANCGINQRTKCEFAGIYKKNQERILNE